MRKGIFVTGTGTDVGKTYVTALLVKALCRAGVDTGYYKAAISGADSVRESDAGYVRRISGIRQPEEWLLSYLYQTPVSPHLAAKLEGNPVELEQVRADFERVAAAFSFVAVEGSGGIVCPIRWDGTSRVLLEDVVKALKLDTLVISDSGLGSINAAVLTVAYLRQKGIGVRGILLNRWEGGVMQQDNRRMIEELTAVPVLACSAPGAEALGLTPQALEQITGGK